MHPSTGLEREYLVRIRGAASQDTITKLTRDGVDIDGKPARFERVLASDMAEEGTNHWYKVVIKEGRYREVRRMWDAVGHTVSRLKRIRYGTIKLTREVLMPSLQANCIPQEAVQLNLILDLQRVEFKAHQEQSHSQDAVVVVMIILTMAALLVVVHAKSLVITKINRLVSLSLSRKMRRIKGAVANQKVIRLAVLLPVGVENISQ